MSRNTNSLDSEIAEKLRPIELPPMPATPLISVLIANYNYAQYIGAAIESVLNQTYQNFEIIVCDDGSTDNSREVVEQFVSRDSRVRLVSKENGGLASALNAAYAASRGEIVCMLDADDLFHPEKIEKVIEAFKKFSRSGFCIHQFTKIAKEGRAFSYPRPMFLAEGWLAAKALRDGGLCATLSGALGSSFRRPVTDLLFPVPSRLRRLVDSYLGHTAQFLTEVCAIHGVLAKLRIHGENISSSAAPTVISVNRTIEDLALMISLVKELLAVHYGSDVAQKLRIQNNSVYCSLLVELHVLNGNRSKEIGGEPLEALVEHIQPYRQKLLMRTLLALPPRLSRWVLQCWAGQSASTATIVRTARSFLRI